MREINLNATNADGVLPSQTGHQQSVDVKGQFTGMVFCPQRQAGIAIMRCGEYQKALGCGKGCTNATSQRLIRLVTESLKLSEKSLQSTNSRQHCLGCSKTLLRLNKDGLCRTCAPGRGYRSICASCGEAKGCSPAKLCRSCAAEGRKEKYGF